MIARGGLPRGYSLDPKCGLALPNELRGIGGRGRIPGNGPRGIGRSPGGGQSSPGAAVVAQSSQARTDILFWSDWRNATGTTNGAARDGTKWTGTYITNPEVRATAGDSLDFPSTNYLRLTDAACGVHFGAADNIVDATEVGESLYLRFYVRNTQSGASGDSHGIYFDDALGSGTDWGPQLAGFYVPSIASNNLTWWLSSVAGWGSGLRRYWAADQRATLVSGVSYRQELKITRASSTTYTMEARIYDISGSLLDGTWTLAPGWPASGDPLSSETFTVSSGAFDSLRGLVVSLEDPQGGSGGYMAVACVAIARNDWCGAYPIAGVES